jgi:hypothetical protein
MDDLPNEETGMESNGDGNESTSSLERETRATNQVESVSMGNGDVAPDDLVSEEAAEDVEIEVVLLSNDEENSGDLPRTLTDNSSGPFRWYLLAPGALAAAGAAALLLKYRSPEGQNGGFLSSQMSGGTAASALQALSGARGGLGSIADSQKARAQALAAQAMARAGKAPARKQKTAWEEAQDSVRTAVSDNLVTIIALAASAGLTIAGRMVDMKREGALPLQPPPKKAWYQIGPWS